MTTTAFNPRTATAAECRAVNAASRFAVGDKVAVNDPNWYRHGQTGVVVKVNRVTIAVRIGTYPAHDIVRGGKCWFTLIEGALA